MSYLIDTNVISEPRRPQPDPKVISWLRHVEPTAVYLSVLSLGELVRGVARVRRRDEASGLRLQRWVDDLQSNFSDRILDVDREVARAWGNLATERTLPTIDSLLAATALVHRMTLVTRNVRDVADTGARVINPSD